VLVLSRSDVEAALDLDRLVDMVATAMATLVRVEPRCPRG
jgi:hypothetical protein